MQYRARGLSPEYLVKAEQFVLGKYVPEGVYLSKKGEYIFKTSKGDSTIRNNDWIVTDGANHYLHSISTFEHLYEPVPVPFTACYSCGLWGSNMTWWHVTLYDKDGKAIQNKREGYLIHKTCEIKTRNKLANELIEQVRGNMDKQQIIDMINELRASYKEEADDLLRRIGQAVLYQDTESANDDAIKAAQKQAKVDVLDELLEKIESD